MHTYRSGDLEAAESKGPNIQATKSADVAEEQTDEGKPEDSQEADKEGNTSDQKAKKEDDTDTAEKVDAGDVEKGEAFDTEDSQANTQYDAQEETGITARENVASVREHRKQTRWEKAVQKYKNTVAKLHARQTPFIQTMMKKRSFQHIKPKIDSGRGLQAVKYAKHEKSIEMHSDVGPDNAGEAGLSDDFKSDAKKGKATGYQSARDKQVVQKKVNVPKKYKNITSKIDTGKKTAREPVIKSDGETDKSDEPSDDKQNVELKEVKSESLPKIRKPKYSHIKSKLSTGKGRSVTADVGLKADTKEQPPPRTTSTKTKANKGKEVKPFDAIAMNKRKFKHVKSKVYDVKPEPVGSTVEGEAKSAARTQRNARLKMDTGTGDADKDKEPGQRAKQTLGQKPVNKKYRNIKSKVDSRRTATEKEDSKVVEPPKKEESKKAYESYSDVDISDVTEPGLRLWMMDQKFDRHIQAQIQQMHNEDDDDDETDEDDDETTSDGPVKESKPKTKNVKYEKNFIEQNKIITPRSQKKVKNKNVKPKIESIKPTAGIQVKDRVVENENVNATAPKAKKKKKKGLYKKEVQSRIDTGLIKRPNKTTEDAGTDNLYGKEPPPVVAKKVQTKRTAFKVAKTTISAGLSLTKDSSPTPHSSSGLSAKPPLPPIPVQRSSFPVKSALPSIPSARRTCLPNSLSSLQKDVLNSPRQLPAISAKGFGDDSGPYSRGQPLPPILTGAGGSGTWCPPAGQLSPMPKLPSDQLPPIQLDDKSLTDVNTRTIPGCKLSRYSPLPGISRNSF